MTKIKIFMSTIQLKLIFKIFKKNIYFFSVQQSKKNNNKKK